MVLLREVSEMLAERGGLPCTLAVAHDDRTGALVLTMKVERGDQSGAALDIVELDQQARYLSGLCSVRMFARDYGIDPEKLERLLPQGGK